MEESEFSDRVDEIIEQLEDELDALELETDDDLDIDSSAGLLTVNFPNGSTVVLSRQVASCEIWLAAISGGFHLSFIDDRWFCRTTQETLSVLLSRVFSEQLGRQITLLA